MNSSHCAGGIERVGPVSWRADVDEASKPRWAGARRAFKFCVIESSIVERDIRRKSVQAACIS